MSMTAMTTNAYTKVNIETASQGKLIVMLFNGAIKRAEEARRELEAGKREEVHKHLIRAQEIIGELRAALNMKTGNIAKSLDRVYEYLQHLMITANIRKDPAPLVDCIAHMTELRDTWEEAFNQVEKEGQALKRDLGQMRHGAALMNLTG